MKNSLRSRTIRLAHDNKQLRPHLLRALKAYEGDLEACGEADLMAGRTWGGLDSDQPADDGNPNYNSHPDSPSAGADGSGQRAKYNQWFRKNVCPGHKTQCGIPGGAK
ncbi:hypothetical protein N9917_00515 [Deltaproteobacteria bacterium]|nr:hypothetical protein [Deltaproteobacteria bacterium]